MTTLSEAGTSVRSRGKIHPNLVLLADPALSETEKYEFRAQCEVVLAADIGEKVEAAIKRPLTKDGLEYGLQLVLDATPPEATDVFRRCILLGFTGQPEYTNGTRADRGKIHPNLVTVRDSELSTIEFRVQCEVALDTTLLKGLQKFLLPPRTLDDLEFARRMVHDAAQAIGASEASMQIIDLAFQDQPR